MFHLYLIKFIRYLFLLLLYLLFHFRLYCSEDTGALLASYIVQGQLELMITPLNLFL